MALSHEKEGVMDSEEVQYRRIRELEDLNAVLAEELEAIRAWARHPSNASLDPAWLAQIDEIRSLPEYRLI